MTHPRIQQDRAAASVTGWRVTLKRAVDLFGSALLLAVLLPAMAVIAAAIACGSAGPVVYAQERTGLGGRPFMMYKFRSMRRGAESGGPVWCPADTDPRITRVGRMLRRTHLDELPQLWNVLIGDMSLVGPRPERPCFVRELDRRIPRYAQRHAVKPGMTGLAQVHYRYDATIDDVKRKLRFDLLYARRMCLALDARILWSTVGVVAAGQGR